MSRNQTPNPRTAPHRPRWLWVEAPTYAPYEDETRDMPPLLTGGSVPLCFLAVPGWWVGR